MVFNVSIPYESHTTPQQRGELERLCADVLTKDGQRGRYQPVQVGDTLLTSMNATGEAQARHVVGAVVGRDPDDLVATARDWLDAAPKIAATTAERRRFAPLPPFRGGSAQ